MGHFECKPDVDYGLRVISPNACYRAYGREMVCFRLQGGSNGALDGCSAQCSGCVICVSAASDRGITAHRLRSRSRAIEPWHWILHASSSQVAATFHSSPCNHCPSSST